jgi:GDP-L-fucose synthase
VDNHTRIYVAGHSGMVGSALVRALQRRGHTRIIERTSQVLDLTRQAEVEALFASERPDYVIDAAARVGGILANKTYRADFIYTNLQIQNNLLNASYRIGVKKLLFLSSSCVYPRACPQPMREEHLWTGVPEPTNEPYAVAKLAGMSMCRAYNEQHGTRFVSVIPTNLYGPNDNYDPEQSHVMASMIRKFHIAKTQKSPTVELWGTGTPRRELMYVDDAADAALHVMDTYDGNDPVNIGVGADCTIRELAETVASVVGYSGILTFDATKPDGSPQKLLDCTRLTALGWQPPTGLADGIARAYQWYLQSPYCADVTTTSTRPASKE